MNINHKSSAAYQTRKKFSVLGATRPERGQVRKLISEMIKCNKFRSRAL